MSCDAPDFAPSLIQPGHYVPLPAIDEWCRERGVNPWYVARG